MPSQEQQSISSYFQPSPSRPSQKRPTSAVVDLTLSDEEPEAGPAAKRPRHTSNGTSTPSPRRNGAASRGTSIAATSGSVANTGLAARYQFGTQASPSSENTENVEERAKKQARHEKFTKLLLSQSSPFFRPRDADSSQQEDAFSVADSDGNDMSEDEAEGTSRVSSLLQSKAFKGAAKSLTKASKGKGKAQEEVGPSGLPYTPLEKQVKALKAKYSDTLLMVEVGYKYRFFAEDAKIASQELGIVCFQDRNFLTAGIPHHRRDIHLKKLLSQGHKVGIIGQTETAALKKVSDNRSGPFERKLTHLYTAATYVDEVDSMDDPLVAASGQGSAPSLLSLTETLLGGMGADEKVSIALISVAASTGDVVWDHFEDGFMRSELETRLAHLKPSEVLIPTTGLSKATAKMLEHVTLPGMHNKSPGKKGSIRIERYRSNVEYTDAYDALAYFFKKTRKDSDNSEKLLANLTALPQPVVIVLAQIVKYLRSFGLAGCLVRTDFFKKFTERQHMLLNSNTLSNLEVYHNQTDFTTRGSLMWILDKTKTAFGSRMLQTWVGKPLASLDALQARVDAVEEILGCEAQVQRSILVKSRELLKGLPDLARGLSRIHYGKCTPKELSTLLKAFNRVAQAFEAWQSEGDVGFASPILNSIYMALPKLRESVHKLMSTINLKKAGEDKRDELWFDEEKYSAVTDNKLLLLTIESELEDQLKAIRKILKKPSAQWASVAGEDYLIEVKKSEKRDIPLTWILVSSTKTLRRYHTPEVKEMLQQRAQTQETLEAEANKAFQVFLGEIAENDYGVLRDAVNKLAILDCLLCFATIASRDGYVKPMFVQEPVLDIQDGRHPMIEELRSDPFVPNSICLGRGELSTQIITGPNMGGKSSIVRMVALIALMAQIGCYVPATHVEMGPLDTILTRMGASDQLIRGRSTFMVEMSETSDILRAATPNSLVILDELGRGSATFDGMAIAGAVVEHLVQNVKCKTLFITHYPSVATAVERRFPLQVANKHMSFSEEETLDGIRSLTFLYRLTKGLASGSYGIECARLAGLPEEILEEASSQAANMHTLVEGRRKAKRTVKCAMLINAIMSSGTDKHLVQELRQTIE